MKIHCPNPECGQKIEVGEEYADQNAHCPTCGKEFTCPTLQEFRNHSNPPQPPPMMDVSKSNPTGMTQLVPSTPGNAAAQPSPVVLCPRCGSNQFVCEKKITSTGWIWVSAGLVNLIFSLILMFIAIGWCFIFLTPVCVWIGTYGCRKLVNTCANCKHEW